MYRMYVGNMSPFFLSFSLSLSLSLSHTHTYTLFMLMYVCMYECIFIEPQHVHPLQTPKWFVCLYVCGICVCISVCRVYP